MERREGEKVLEPSLLAGIVFDACSESMTPTHAVKERTQYRYYISRHLIIGRCVGQFPTSAGPGGESRGPRHRPPARSLDRSRPIRECDLEWRTRCADAEEFEGRGGGAVISLGTSADRDAPRLYTARFSSRLKFTLSVSTLMSA